MMLSYEEITCKYRRSRYSRIQEAWYSRNAVYAQPRLRVFHKLEHHAPVLFIVTSEPVFLLTQ